MRGYKLKFSIAIFALLFGASESRAAEPFVATTRPEIESCKVYYLKDGTFVPARTGVFKPGYRMAGHYHQTRADLFVGRGGAYIFAIPSRCLTIVKVAGDGVTGAGTPPGTAPRAPVRPNIEGRFRFLFYQDTVNITDATNGDFSVLSHVSAVCAGFAYQRRLTNRLTFVADACAMFGYADARGSFVGDTTIQEYSFNHATTMGLRVVPSIEMPFAGRDFKLGLGVPFILQTVGWGDTAGGATAASSAFLFPSAVITIQATRDRFGFIADFGFMKKLTQASYSIGMSLKL